MLMTLILRYCALVAFPGLGLVPFMLVSSSQVRALMMVLVVPKPAASSTLRATMGVSDQQQQWTVQRQAAVEGSVTSSNYKTQVF